MRSPYSGAMNSSAGIQSVQIAVSLKIANRMIKLKKTIPVPPKPIP
jgi:hypothetical protein